MYIKCTIMNSTDITMRQERAVKKGAAQRKEGKQRPEKEKRDKKRGIPRGDSHGTLQAESGEMIRLPENSIADPAAGCKQNPAAGRIGEDNPVDRRIRGERSGRFDNH